MTGAYAAGAAADPFDRAASFLTSLIHSLSRPEALLLPHERVEEDAEQGARELARLLLQSHLDLRARREEAELATLDRGGRAQLAAGRTRLEKGHRRQLATVVGPVTVSRCALRAPGLPNRYPADQVLGLPHERHSLGLRRLVVLEAARGSYDHALEAIERRCGTRAVGKRQTEQLVRAAAADIAAFYAARTPDPAASTTLLVLSDRRHGDRDAPGASAGGNKEGGGTGDAHVPHPSVHRGEDLPQADGHTGRRPRRRSGRAPAAPRARGPRPARNGSPPRFNTTRTRSSLPRSTRHKPVTRSTAAAGWFWSTAPPTSSS